MRFPLALLVLILYFLPSIIAFSKGKKDLELFFVVNVITGWTVIGWLVCFYWAFLK